MRLVMAILAVVLLASCATVEKYEAKLQTWVGSAEERLIASWGPPDSFYESGGTRYLTYAKSRTVVTAGTAPTTNAYVVGSQVFTSTTPGSPGSVRQRSCKTTFIVKNSVITDWQHKGNDCKSE